MRGFLFNKLKINASEKHTFGLHLLYALIEGFITGVFILNEFVFIRSLKGSSYQLSILFQFSVIVLLIAVFTNELMETVKNKKRLLRIIAVVTRLPLIVMLFLPSVYGVPYHQQLYNYFFLFVFFMYYMASPVVLPSINLLLKSNYSHENFGRLYSLVTSYNKVVMLVVTFLFGLLLDYDNYAFRYIYPIAGVLGICSVFLLTRINDSAIAVKVRYSVLKRVKEAFSSSLLRNRAFRDFQISLMCYGFGFMSTVTVITIFYDVVLELNYTSVAFYKNVYNILAILILPYFGRLISRIDQRRFSVISILSLLFYIIFVLITAYVPEHFSWLGLKIYYMMIPAVIFHAFFAATMSLSWSIGSAYFCNKEDAGLYQSVHLSMTGLRGLVFPIFGVVLYENFGFTVTFITASAAMLVGVLLLLWSEKYVSLQKK